MSYTEKERCHPCCGADEDPNPLCHWIVDTTDEIVVEREVPAQPFFLFETGCLPTLVIDPDDQVRPVAAITHETCVREEECVEREGEPEAQDTLARNASARNKEEVS